MAVSEVQAARGHIGAGPMDWAAEADSFTAQLTGEESFDAKTGIKTRITYETKYEKVGDKADDPTYEVHYKVVTKLKTEEKRVPKIVAHRKKWAKFGDSAGDKRGEPASATTFLGDDQKVNWTRKSTGEAILVDESQKGSERTTGAGGTLHCRLCKQDGHWSAQCPYKDQLQEDEDTDELEASAAAAGVGTVDKTGKYIPPSQRGGSMTMGGMDSRRSDENTLRITNLPTHTEEKDLRELIEKAIQSDQSKISSSAMGRTPYQKRISRLFMAKNKISGDCKGFAYVTFESAGDAERARKLLDNHKYEYSVLKVEFSKPRDA